jgi:hypothetical protein
MTHPGTITYVDDDAKTEKVLPVSQVPEALRFGQMGELQVPVVKVVAKLRGGELLIREYGPKGELLRSTLQRKG